MRGHGRQNDLRLLERLAQIVRNRDTLRKLHPGHEERILMLGANALDDLWLIGPQRGRMAGLGERGRQCRAPIPSADDSNSLHSKAISFQPSALSLSTI